MLRGPFSVLYGNAAGGVVQLWSAAGTPTPLTTLGVNAGSHDSFRSSIDTRGTLGPLDYNIARSLFVSGGPRPHSRVRRESDNARFGVDLGGGKKLTLVANRLNQPVAQDALGLTRAARRHPHRSPRPRDSTTPASASSRTSWARSTSSRSAARIACA
ncbi:hypothetical protein [Rhodanobacter lindaniclasticus]